MLDEIISKCINEIALNGGMGMKPSELWTYIDGMIISGREDKPLKLTDPLKRRIHSLILENSSIMVLNPLAVKSKNTTTPNTPIPKPPSTPVRKKPPPPSPKKTSIC